MVSHSCRLTSKFLDGEMNQENVNTNVAQEPETNYVNFEANVAKTPAARSTRKAAATASCSSKVQESNRGELVQSAYNTRRSTRLFEKCMADLSLKTKETLDKPEKIEETEQKVSAHEKHPAEKRSEEAGVIPGRDLSASMENAPETEKINTFDEVKTVDQIDGGSEAESEEDNSGVDSYGTIAKADSNQADQAIQENDSESANINTFNEINNVDQSDGGSESEPEEDNSGVDSDETISEAGSNLAVQGSDIADEEMILSEPEVSVTVPTSPPLVLEEVQVKTASVSSIAADSISAQFPRPNKSASKKLVNVGNTDKENNMEVMMNVVNNSDNGERKGEAKKKSKKKVEIDEENLKDASIRQLVKMVKELSIKSSNNRTALQILRGNNQITE